MHPAADRRAKGTGRQGRQEETRNHAERSFPTRFCRKPRSWPATVLCPRCSRPANSPAKPPCKAIQDEVGAKLVEKFGAEKVTEFVLKDAFYYIQKEAVRGLILNSGKRLDGRAFDVVRPISSEVGILPRAHGSALFRRGETQAVTLVTLGTGDDAQEFDSYTGGDSEKKFILHYNFPNFSVGETGRISGPGRREIGHGALAERSIEPMLPLENYPYTVRVTSEIMESNGSTSMATRLRRHPGADGRGRADDPPGGRHQHRHLHRATTRATRSPNTSSSPTSSAGKTHYCDMDCKIAGTEKGITGFQLDLKLQGPAARA